ncbi:PREDICTED: uncharacterized protein LOC104777664 [Camelina sativa]|uniref:Uncharacterized protein LOC104777664 n=1 Tax=Camelina sativa TaxID=90675 RepID=A0ABM0YFS6_CAMSA|nr:PREDICTED: uncharacterized protein LOC104777664 [Camelina sativa]
MASSKLISSMLFLLLLVFSLHMDEALAAQRKIRKLKEIIKVGRNLEDNDYKSSKRQAGGSVSNKCHSKSYTTTVTTYLITNESSSPCIKCDVKNGSCYSCTKTRKCRSSNGSPWRCTVTELCCLIEYS